MSTRERSKLRRFSSASAAARIAVVGRAARRRLGATSPSGSTSTAPASSSRDDGGRELGLRELGLGLQLGRLDGAAVLAHRREHLGDLVDLDVAGPGEEAPQPDVLAAVEEHGVGRLAVAARAAELLVVGVERLGGVGVDHTAHVGLVDAHAERGRGHDDVEVAGHEALLHLVAPGFVMPAW